MSNEKPYVKNALTIDFEDWYQPFACRRVPHWKNYESRIPEDTDRVLALLGRLDVRATFFVLGEVAELFPEAVRAIHRAGHEIASHGYRHEPLFQQERCLFDMELRESIKYLSDLTGERVEGFRAPFFSLRPDTEWVLESLERVGLRYSSSVQPTAALFHGHRRGGRLPFLHTNGIREFPITTLPIPGFAVPFGGGVYYRLMPRRTIEWGLSWLNRRRRPGIVYFHPRELDPDLPRLKVGPLLHLVVYAGVQSFENKLARLLQEFRFVPLREL